jgi:hypothetical protein
MAAPSAYNGVASVEIQVNDFAQEFTLAEVAKLFKMPEATFTGIHATATYEIPVSDIKSVFKFKADDYINLITNARNGNMTDLHFWCIDPSGNLSDSEFAQNSTVTDGKTATTDVTGTALTDAQQKLPQDYYRYLAKKIFGVPQGVDMIANENEIMGDLETKINAAWNTNILSHTSGVLGQQYADGGLTVLDESEATVLNIAEALDNSEVRSASVCACQYFFYQLMEKDQERFALKEEGSTGLLEPDAASLVTGGVASLPFKVGDSISFPLTIKTHAEQRSYIDGSSIADHKYKIKLLLKA